MKYKESQVYFYPILNEQENFLSFQLIENKPTNHSILKIKNNLGDLRFVKAKS